LSLYIRAILNKFFRVQIKGVLPGAVFLVTNTIKLTLPVRGGLSVYWLPSEPTASEQISEPDVQVVTHYSRKVYSERHSIQLQTYVQNVHHFLIIF